MLRVAVSEDAVIEALLRSRRLSEDQALRRAQIEQAVAAILAEWAERWLTDGSHA